LGHGWINGALQNGQLGLSENYAISANARKPYQGKNWSRLLALNGENCTIQVQTTCDRHQYSAGIWSSCGLRWCNASNRPIPESKGCHSRRTI